MKLRHDPRRDLVPARWRLLRHNRLLGLVQVDGRRRDGRERHAHAAFMGLRTEHGEDLLGQPAASYAALHRHDQQLRSGKALLAALEVHVISPLCYSEGHV